MRPAAGARRHAGGARDRLHAVEFAAPLAVIAQGAAVELKDLLAAGGLMESVDVLRDDGLQLARALPLGELTMRGVWLRVGAEELCAVEGEEFLGIAFVVGVAQDRFGRVAPLLVVESVHAAEVGDAALGRDACSAEEDDVVAAVDDLLELSDLLCHSVCSFTWCSLCRSARRQNSCCRAASRRPGSPARPHGRSGEI